jgi:hypothetical protein
VPCGEREKEPEEPEEELEEGALPAAAAAATVQAASRPKRRFEEDNEDEDGARLRRKHLACISSNDAIRAALGRARGYCSPRHRLPFNSRNEGSNAFADVAGNVGQALALGDERLVASIAKIDGAARAEQALDSACEDPGFREFTEKVLNILAACE